MVGSGTNMVYVILGLLLATSVAAPDILCNVTKGDFHRSTAINFGIERDDIGRLGLWCDCSKICMPAKMACDGVDDCDNGVDEECDNGVCRCLGNRTCHNNVTGETRDIVWCSFSSRDLCIDPLTWKMATCNGINECDDGYDEQDCPWLLPPSLTFVGSLATVAVSGLMYWCIRRFNKEQDRKGDKEEPRSTEDDLLNSEAGEAIDNFIAEIRKPLPTNQNIDNQSTNVIIDNQSRNQTNDNQSINQTIDNQIKPSHHRNNNLNRIFLEIHSLGAIKQLTKCLQIYIPDPVLMHEIAIAIVKSEESVHGDRCAAMRCLRENCGSNKSIGYLLALIESPSIRKKLNKFVNDLIDAFWNLEFLRTPKIRSIIKLSIKLTIAGTRISFFIWDTVKDFVLWAILYNKKDQIDNSLLWLFLTTIFLAQSTVGVYITKNRTKILKVPENIKTWKKCALSIAMFLLTPFLPGIVLFKTTIYRAEIRQMIAQARTNDENKPSQVLAAIEKKEHEQFEIKRVYSIARIIEATIETGMQTSIVIALTVNTPFLLNKEDLTSSTSIFIMFSFIYSMVLMLSGIVGFINVNKKDSLGLRATSMLVLAYLCQLVASIAARPHPFDTKKVEVDF